ncbi:hypothetical protein U9M48_009281 [Paspalum notatum var. saurae]|uniref:SHSP domain-containing protein n=1 Tax=Paspalum notatum var. saurae TaxID=547442 RepID=A0AAQ3WEY1_PASNO
MASSGDRAYEDFVPKHEMTREPATHTLSVDLSDEGKQAMEAHLSLVRYKKEHIRVQMVHSQRRLVVRGERPAGGDRWRRFRLELRVPDGCDAKAIHARFENGVVRVTMPGVAPEPVQVDTKQDPSSPTTPKPPTSSPSSSAQDQKQKDGGGRAAAAGEGEGEGDKQKDEVAAAQKQETVRQRVSSAKDGTGGGVGEEVTTSASPPRQGYGFGFVPGRKMMVTTVIGVVFVLVTLGIYVRYSVSP